MPHFLRPFDAYVTIRSLWASSRGVMLHVPSTASVDINAVRNPFAPSWMLLDPSSRRITLSNQQSWIPVLMTQHSLTCSVLHGGLLSLSLPMGTLAVVRVLIQELILLFTLSCLSNPSQQCAHLSTSTYRIAARSRRRTMKRADHLSRDPAYVRSVSFTTPFSCPFFSQCTKYALKRG